MNERELAHFLARLPAADFWVFGYGSLMWNPGFQFLRSRPVRIRGYHRALCIDSTAHRGTLERPGLVLGLAPGGTCRGMAFLVARRNAARCLRGLWEREMADGTYLARMLAIEVDGKRDCAVAFVVNRRHRFYAGALPLSEIARRVLACAGERGTNVDYLMNTFEHLRSLGVHDRRLAQIVATVRAQAARGGEHAHGTTTDERRERIRGTSSVR